MTSEWKILLRCLHGALGQFLKEVDGCQPVAEPVAAAQQVLPLTTVAPKVVEAAPPPEPVAVVAEVKAEEEVAPPSVQDIQDPGFSREKILRFLATRGYDYDVWKEKPRPEINKTALQALESMQAIAPGVKTRKPRATKTEKANDVAPAKDESTAMSVIAELSDEVVAKVASMLQLDPQSPSVRVEVANLLVTAEAAKHFVAGIDAVEPEPVAVATVERPSAPPIPATVSRPATVALKVEEKKGPSESDRLLVYITEKYGAGGKLYEHVTSPIISEYAPALEQIVQEALASGDAEKKSRAEKYTGIMGCNGRCVDCPRSGAQLTACLAIHDEERDPEGVDKVLAGEILLRFAQVDHDPWSPRDTPDGPAVATLEASL